MASGNDHWGYKIGATSSDDPEGRGRRYSGSVHLEGLGGFGSVWENVTLEYMDSVASAQDPEAIRQAATFWGKMSAALEAMSTGFKTAGKSLQKGWDPEAGKAAANFFQHTGATTWSFDEWAVAARNYQVALDSAAAEASSGQRSMKTIIASYKAELRRVEAEQTATGLAPNLGNTDENSVMDSTRQEIIDRYKLQAVPVMQRLAKGYSDNIDQLAEGLKFQGPLSAPDPTRSVLDSAAGGGSSNRGSGSGGTGGGSSRSDGGGNRDTTILGDSPKPGSRPYWHATDVYRRRLRKPPGPRRTG